MMKYGYDELQEHRTEHQDLIKSAKDLQAEILQSDKPVAVEHVEFLERWLTEHILTADMRLGSFLTAVM